MSKTKVELHELNGHVVWKTFFHVAHDLTDYRLDARLKARAEWVWRGVMKLAIERHCTLNQGHVFVVGTVDIHARFELAVVFCPVGADGSHRGRRHLLELLEQPTVLLATIRQEISERVVVKILNGQVGILFPNGKGLLTLL